MELLHSRAPQTGMHPSFKSVAHHNVLPHKAMQATHHNAAAAPAAPKPQLQTTGKTSFNQSAGVFGNMAGRLKKSLASLASGGKSGAKKKKGVKDKSSSGIAGGDDEEETSLFGAVGNLFDKMQDDGGGGDTRGRQAEVDAKLEEEGRDPLQRYVLYQTALLELEDQKDLSPEQKNELRGSLKKMMSDVHKKHPEIDKGLQETKNVKAIISAMMKATNLDPHSVPEMRFLYAGKKNEKVQPLDLLRKFKKHVGAKDFIAALRSVRSNAMAGLRRF